MNTQPTLQTILDRINELDLKFEQRFVALEQRFDKLETEMRKHRRMVETLSVDVVDVRSELGFANKQLEELKSLVEATQPLRP